MQNMAPTQIIVSISMVIMLLGMSASFAIDADESAELPEIEEEMDAHWNRNYPGSTSGSIYSLSTMTASWGHTCVVLHSGTAKCWGEGGAGRLGNGNNAGSTTPAPVSGLTNARELVSFGHHSCAMVTDNNSSLECWGENFEGQLGNSDGGWFYWVPSPTTMPQGRTAVTISPGGHHSCGIMDDLSLWCWGWNEHGQMGNGGGGNTDEPVNISGNLPAGRTVVAVNAGWDSTCAILDDGSGVCWGVNNHGQLGDGTYVNRSTPTPISALPANRAITAISIGPRSACSILDDGNVVCWGNNEYGLLGDNTTTNATTEATYVDLPLGRTAISIDVGFNHACALLDDKSAVCWGDNREGQIGDNTTTNRYKPTEISMPTGLGVASISAGRDHTCVVATNASVWCWGGHEEGQLGLGTNVDSDVPAWVNIGSGMHAFLGERDHDDDGILSIFDATPYPPPICPAGQYLVGYDCVDTSPGNYTPTSGMTEQIPCPVGSFQPHSGQSFCYDAIPGYYSDSNGSISMSPCLAGTFQNQSGQTTCIDTPPGFFTVDDAAANPTPCGIGRYQPNSGQTSCLTAEAGNYVPTVGQVIQTPCEPGTYQPGFGRTSCYLADLGHHVSQEGSIDQEECQIGTYADVPGLSDCKGASPGYFVDTGAATTQTSCSPGEYQPMEGQSSCPLVEAGHFTDESGASAMNPCEVGQYQENIGSTSCVEADLGNYVPTEGASSQTPCPSGTFTDQTGTVTCTDAPPGSHVPAVGSTTSTPCSEGTFQSESGEESCDDAPPGHYAASEGMIDSQPCGPGTYQTEAGMTGCLSTNPGHYTDSDGNHEEVPCPPGQYQDDAGSTSCKPAPAGRYVEEQGSTEYAECSAGTYQPDSGQSTCIEADPGYHVESERATEQVECRAGTYQPNAGQSSCLPAEAGYFVESTGAAAQIACSPGTYQSRTEMDNCVEAGIDKYVASSGAISETECGSGTHQPLRGQTECITLTEGSSLPIVPIVGALILVAVGAYFIMNKGGPKGGPKGGSDGGKKRRRPPPAGAERLKRKKRN